MPKSRLRGGKTAHRKRVANRNQILKQKKMALTKKIIEQMNQATELHHKLKSVATKHNISMNVLVEKLLESQEPSNSDIFVI